MLKKTSFIETQFQFANAIRDPENKGRIDGIEQRRMDIYQSLFYNNIEGFVAGGFPVLRALISDSDWHSMIRDFMVKHRCKTPLFHEISREFLAYLDNERDNTNDPIFMKELAHYEWVELALSVLDADIINQINSELDLLSQPLTLSPLAWSLVYNYPVHQISTDFQPQQPSESPHYLLVYRNKGDNITFLELNPVSARLINLLGEGLTGKIAAEKIAEELQHPTPKAVIDGAQSLVKNWVERGILV